MRRHIDLRRLLAAIGLTLFTSSMTAATALAQEPASPPQKVSRADALDRLKRESYPLLAARYRVTQARAEIVAAGVWTNPNVNVTALTLTHGTVTGGQTELVVSVDQVLPIGGQVGLRKDVAQGFFNAEERAYAATLWQLVSDAKIAYIDLQRAEARVRVLRAGLVDLGRVETVVDARATAGAISPYDKVRVSAERGKLESRRAQADVDATVARAALAEAVGARSIDMQHITADETIDEAPDPPRVNNAADLDPLVRRAIAQRPEVGTARARADATELRISYLRRQYFPSPGVSVGYSRYLEVPGATPSGGGALIFGISVPVPLLDHGQGTIDRGIAAAAEERANQNATELSVRRQVEQAVLAMSVRVEAWRRFRDTNAKDLPRLRSIAELSYREGRATILELLDAYATFLDGEERAIDLRAAAARSTLDLERAVGPQ